MSSVIQALQHPEQKAIKEVCPRLYHTSLSLVKVVGFYTLCCVYFVNVEGWGIGDCIYFLTVTITTVGFGDFTPSSDGARVFTIFTILIGLIFIFTIINDFARNIVDAAVKKAEAIAKSKAPEDIDEKGWIDYAKRYFYPVGLILLVVFIGSLFFWINEDWTFIEAVYMAFVTTTTVGYGDLILKYKSSRIFLIFYIPVSVCAVAAALGSVTSIQYEMEAEKKRIANMKRKLDFAMIREMDTDGDGVDKCEFLVAMLVQNQLCEQKDIDPWLKRFEELDKDQSGRLDEEDIRILEMEEEQRLRSIDRRRSSDALRSGTRTGTTTIQRLTSNLSFFRQGSFSSAGQITESLGSQSRYSAAVAVGTNDIVLSDDDLCGVEGAAIGQRTVSSANQSSNIDEANDSV